MSNKTQLQTNNTKLTSLIAELANKAAGSGGSSGENGGDYQVAIGLADYDYVFITAQNLPFTPQFVAIIAMDTSGNNYTGGMIASVVGTLDGIQYSQTTHTSGNASMVRLETTTSSIIDIVENGFEALPLDGVCGTQFMYIAIAQLPDGYDMSDETVPTPDW